MFFALPFTFCCAKISTYNKDLIWYAVNVLRNTHFHIKYSKIKD